MIKVGTRVRIRNDIAWLRRSGLADGAFTAQWVVTTIDTGRRNDCIPLYSLNGLPGWAFYDHELQVIPTYSVEDWNID